MPSGDSRGLEFRKVRPAHRALGPGRRIAPWEKIMLRIAFRATATALSKIQPMRVLKGIEVVVTFIMASAAVLFVSFAAVMMGLS